jgi:hypothetical protein
MQYQLWQNVKVLFVMIPLNVHVVKLRLIIKKKDFGII